MSCKCAHLQTTTPAKSMSDATVRGNSLYTARLSALALSNPRGYGRVPQSKVNRAYRVATCRDTGTAALPFAEHRESQSLQQQAVRDRATGASSPNFGYPRHFHGRYSVGEQLGSGGYASVFLVTDKQTSKTLACKSISKSREAGASSDKEAEHIEAIKREILVLKRLRGSLNVACLEEVYEDDTHVHLLMEYCKGGELVHRIGDRHYSERTVCNNLATLAKQNITPASIYVLSEAMALLQVASYMRAVLRTLYQCHSNHILHRDVKPGKTLSKSAESLPPYTHSNLDNFTDDSCRQLHACQ